MIRRTKLPVFAKPAVVGRQQVIGVPEAIRIFLSSVVLDRPDNTGLYIAKDIACGWAYLIADDDGDHRFRGSGICGGGLDVALRCSLLSAINRVPDFRQLRILVDTRQAHQTMVLLALEDHRVTAALEDRPVVVMTRPLERSSFQVRAAAERAASIALVNRERAERYEASMLAGAAEARLSGRFVVETIAPITTVNSHETEKRANGEEDKVATKHRESVVRDWRNRQIVDGMRALTVQKVSNGSTNSLAPLLPASLSTVQRLVRPLVDGARNGLAAASVLGRRHSEPRSRVMAEWFNEIDNHVAGVNADLRDMGA